MEERRRDCFPLGWSFFVSFGNLCTERCFTRRTVQPFKAHISVAFSWGRAAVTCLKCRTLSSPQKQNLVSLPRPRISQPCRQPKAATNLCVFWASHQWLHTPGLL